MTRWRPGVLSCLLLALASGQAVAASTGLDAVEVKDLHYGDVLFHFYQDDYFNALIRHDAYRAQGRLAVHGRDAELLRGGIYLSLGQHREAREIFERLLQDAATTAEVRGQAWFYLGKLQYDVGQFEASASSLRQAARGAPDRLDAERRMLLAQGLMFRGQYDAAISELQGWQGPAEWLAYARFNLGVALVRAGQKAPGLAQLEQVGQLVTTTPELLSLRDRANLALGYARLQDNEAAVAQQSLGQVRLEGPHSSKALLGAGWASASVRDYRAALVPWLELQRRSLQDAAVQESYLAVPFAYAELGAFAQAAEQYEQAIAAYERERSRLADSIVAIRSGQLLQQVLDEESPQGPGWFWQMSHLPDTAEAAYLYPLLASLDFQAGVKNYRALQQMGKNLNRWSDSLEAFTDMVEVRGRAFEQRVPAADDALSRANPQSLLERHAALQSQYLAAIRDQDPLAFATAGEQAWLGQVVGVEQALAAHVDDADFADARDKVRLARGVLQWKLQESWKLRAWQASRQLRELEQVIQQLGPRERAARDALGGAPARQAAIAVRVAAVQPRVDALALRVEAARQSASQVLAEMAVQALEQQRVRLDDYAVQAHYALATIYDRAANPAETP